MAALKALLVLLGACIAYGSVIPQSRSSSMTIAADWDREYDFDKLGLQLKIKFNDPTTIFSGGRVHVDFRVPKFVTAYAMGISGIELDVDIKGIEIARALFNAKVAYKVDVNGVAREGTVEVVREVETAEVVTKLVINGVDFTLKNFKFDTDYKSRAGATFVFRNKVCGLRIERVAANNVALVFTVDGKEIDVLKNFKIDTDYKTKAGVIFEIINKVYGLRIERDTANNVALVFIADGKEFDVMITPDIRTQSVRIHSKASPLLDATIAINPLPTDYGIIAFGKLFSPVDFKFLLREDFRFAKIEMTINNMKLAEVTVDQQVKMGLLLPEKITTEVNFILNQGKMAEGKIIIELNTVGQKTISLTLAPKTGPAYTFTVGVALGADLSLAVEHKLLRDQAVVYQMVHKSTLLYKSAQKWGVMHADQCTIPKASPIYMFLQGNDLADLLTNFERKMILDVQMALTAPFITFDYRDVVAANGIKHFEIDFNNAKALAALQLYFPEGPKMVGMNIGLRHLVKQDGFTYEMNVDWTRREILVSSDLMNHKIIVRLPNIYRSPIFAIESTYTKDNKKNFELTVERVGTVFKVNMVSDVMTTMLPLLCSTPEGCHWSSHFNYEADVAKRNFGILPAQTLSIAVNKDLLTLVEVHHSTGVNPIFFRMHCPLIMAKPLALTASNEATTLAFSLNVFELIEGTIMLQKNLKFAQVVLNINNIHLLDVTVDGELKTGEMLPEMIKYEVKYKVYQGLVTEGKIAVEIHTIGQPAIFVTIAPKTGPAYNFEMRATVAADLSFELEHKLLRGQLTVYKMVHKPRLIYQSTQKLVVIHEDLITVPKTSPLQVLLLQGTYLGDLLVNLERKITVNIELTKALYQFDYRDSILANKVKYFEMVLNNRKTKITFQLYFPEGPELMGNNLGFKHMFGQDAFTYAIDVDAANHKILVKSDLMNHKVIVTLPNIQQNTIFSIVSTYTEKDTKAFEFAIEKIGMVFKVRLISDIVTPRIPLLCHNTASCRWSSVVMMEADLTNRMFGLVPVSTVTLSVVKDTNTLMEVHQSTTNGPLALKVNGLLAKIPLDLTANFEGKAVTLSANILDLVLANILVEKDLSHAGINVKTMGIDLIDVKVLNGKEITLTANILDLVFGNILIQKDLRHASINVKTFGIQLIDVEVNGDMKFVGLVPALIKYEVNCLIYDGQLTDGKFTVDVNGNGDKNTVAVILATKTMPKLMECIFDLQKDFTIAHFMFNINHINLLDVKATGKIKMGKTLPETLRYEITYMLNQGILAQGRTVLDVNAIAAQKTLAIEYSVQTLYALGFDVKATLTSDLALQVEHKLVRGAVPVYEMKHILNIIFKVGQMLSIKHQDKCTIPPTSPLYFVLQGTYLGDLLFNFERIMTAYVDLTAIDKIYNLNFENTIFANGVKHLNMAFNTQKMPIELQVYFPKGPRLMGYELGLKQLLGQDMLKYRINIDLAKWELDIFSNFMNKKIIIKLPDINGKTIFSMISTITEKDKKAFEFTVERVNTVLKMIAMADLETPRLPLVCTTTPKCQWSGNIHVDVDMGNFILGPIPAYSVVMDMHRDTDTLMKLYISTKSNPIVLSLKCPLLPVNPLDVTVTNEVSKLAMAGNMFGLLNCNFIFHKNLELAELALNFMGIDLLNMKVNGKMKMGLMLPEAFKYDVQYMLYQGMAEGLVHVDLHDVGQNKVFSFAVAPKTLPALLNCGFTIQKDLQFAQILIQSNGIDLIDLIVDGGLQMGTWMPESFKYEVKYKLFMSELAEGKVNVDLNLIGGQTTLSVMFAPRPLPNLLSIKFSLQNNLEVAQMVCKVAGINLLNIRADGTLKMLEHLPQVFKYEVKYQVIHGLLLDGRMNVDLNTVGEQQSLGVLVAPTTLPNLLNLKFLLQKDLKLAEVVCQVVGQDVIHLKADGEFKMGALVPEVFKYDISYHIMPQHIIEGKMVVDLKTIKGQHVLLINFTPITPISFLVNAIISPDFSFKITKEMIMGQTIIYKVTKTHKIIQRSAKKWESECVLTGTIPKSSPLVTLLKGTYLETLIFDVENKITMDIDWTAKETIPAKFDMKSIVLVNGVKKVEYAINKMTSKNIMKLGAVSTIFTPNLPLFCTKAGGCEWSSNIVMNADMTKPILGVIPAPSVSIAVNRDFEALVEVLLDTMTHPYLIKLNCPLLMPRPLEVTMTYTAGKDVVIKANMLIPGELKVMIDGTVNTVIYEDVRLAVIDFDLAKKSAVLRLPVAQTPRCTIGWATDKLLNNQFRVNFVLPLLGKVLDVTADLQATSDLSDCSSQVNTVVELPVVGKFQLSNNLALSLSKVKSRMSASAKSKISNGLMDVVSPFDSSLVAEYDLPAMTIGGRADMMVAGKSVGVLVKDNQIVNFLY